MEYFLQIDIPDLSYRRRIFKIYNINHTITKVKNKYPVTMQIWPLSNLYKISIMLQK